MSSMAAASKTSSKGAKKSKIVVLRLSPDSLARFSSEVPPSPSPIKDEPSPSVQPTETADKTSESNSTPLPSNANDETDANSLAPPKGDNKRKRGGGNVSGRKRAPPVIDPNAPPRERGRPGPKKKPRLPDGTIDRTTAGKNGPAAGAAAVPAHKLGPKANTGAINAGLRALDRTGKPCRKWERKPLQIKSFTGTVWGMPSWKTLTRDSAFSGDVKSDSTGSSDINHNRSSALASEQDVDVDNPDHTMANGIESSPAPPVIAA